MRSRGSAEEVQRIRAAHIVSPCRARKPKGNPRGDYGCGEPAFHDHRALPFRAVVGVFSDAWHLRSTTTTMPSIRRDRFGVSNSARMNAARRVQSGGRKGLFSSRLTPRTARAQQTQGSILDWLHNVELSG